MPVFQLRRAPQLLSPCRRNACKGSRGTAARCNGPEPTDSLWAPRILSAKCVSFLHSRAPDRQRRPGVSAGRHSTQPAALDTEALSAIALCVHLHLAQCPVALGVSDLT